MKRKAEGIGGEPAYRPTVTSDSDAFRLALNALHSSFSVLSVPSVVQEFHETAFLRPSGPFLRPGSLFIRLG